MSAFRPVVRSRATRWLVAALVVVALAPAATFASFHIARIVEIFGGTAAHPTAQYIVIKPFTDFQNVFSGVEVTVFNSSGAPLPNFATFTANLSSSFTNQKSILVATSDAQTILGIPADQTATGTLPPSGLICFKKSITIPDCVSYGNYTGNTSAGGSPAGPPAPGMGSGIALVRDLGANGTLQSTDDANNSAADFFLAGPGAENFNGTRVSNLTVDATGGVTLFWTNTASIYTIHKTDDPATVRGSAAVATQSGTTWADPLPNQFPDITFYVVKP